MARRFPTFVALLPLLAACATTAPTTHPTAEARIDTSPDGAVVYLEGMTTRYSVRLDELRTHQTSAAHQERLPNAVVAGDENMTVAATLYRHADALGADLIIRNHGEGDLEVDRARIELTDDEGRTLVPLLEWPKGMDYGLRALAVRSRSYRPMGTDHQAGQAGIKGDQPTSQLHKPRTPETRLNESAIKVGDTPLDVSWISDLDRERTLITAPTVFVLHADEDTPYWVYWRPEEVSYPLTLSIRMGGRRMLFRFDDPAAAASNVAR